MLTLLCVEFTNDLAFFTIRTRENTYPTFQNNSLRIPINSRHQNLSKIRLSFKKPVDMDQKFEFKLVNINTDSIAYTFVGNIKDILIQNNYLFEFPLIPTSKNVIYSADLTSIDDRKKMRLKLISRVDNVEIQYKFNIKDFTNFQNIYDFFSGKIYQYILNSYSNGNLVFYFALFLCFIIFKIIQTLFTSHLQSKSIFIHINELFKGTVVGLFITSIIKASTQTPISDQSVMTMAGLWLFLVILYEFTPEKSFIFAISYLVMSSILKTSGMQKAAENMAILAFSFLIVGTLHGLILINRTTAHFFKLNTYFQRIKALDSQIDKFIDSWILLRNQSIRTVIKSGTITVVLFFGILIIVSSYIKLTIFRDRQLKNPSITIMEPMLVYRSTKVVLYGKSFGEKKDERYRIMRNGKEIRTDYWDDSKIIFTIPLDWKPGEYAIWIERPIEWNTETIIEKTKPQTLKVLPVTGKITPDDDLYFKQMDTLRKETKEINGF